MPDVTASALKLAALLAALTEITVEDLAALKQATSLGDDAVTNITNLQAMAQNLDQATIDLLNKARTDAGLPPL